MLSSWIFARCLRCGFLRVACAFYGRTLLAGLLAGSQVVAGNADVALHAVLAVVGRFHVHGAAVLDLALVALTHCRHLR